MEKKNEPFIRVDKVSEITSFTISYIYKLVNLKKIPHYKPTGRKGKVLFRESEIFDFLNQSRQLTDYEVSANADALLNGDKK